MVFNVVSEHVAVMKSTTWQYSQSPMMAHPYGAN